MGRIPHGDDLIRSLETYCETNGVQAAWVQALGALSKATLAYYDQKTHVYHTRELSGEYEIVSCTGNITLKDGKPFGHIHMILSDTEYQCLAGHLMPGTTEIFACEFILHVFEADEALNRVHDDQTGLTLWSWGRHCPG